MQFTEPMKLLLSQNFTYFRDCSLWYPDPKDLLFKSYYLGYNHSTKGNHSHHFGYNWLAGLSGIWNSESGFPKYNGTEIT